MLIRPANDSANDVMSYLERAHGFLSKVSRVELCMCIVQEAVLEEAVLPLQGEPSGVVYVYSPRSRARGSRASSPR